MAVWRISLLLFFFGLCLARPDATDTKFDASEVHETLEVIPASWSFREVARKAFQFIAPPPEDEPHKPLWPISNRDIASISLAAFIVVLASSSGIGGGALLVPLYLVILDFPTSSAVALSNITIVGSTFVNLAINIFRYHPIRHADSLINWNLILIMEPSTILGAVLGGYINKVRSFKKP